MNKCCPLIQVLNPPNSVPSRFLEPDGSLYLDTILRSSNSLSSKIQELSELHKLGKQSSSVFEIPPSPKNNSCVHENLNLNIIDDDYSALQVIVWYGEDLNSTLEGCDLFVMKNRRPGNNNYEAILLSQDHWIDKAKEQQLCKKPYTQITILILRF